MLKLFFDRNSKIAASVEILGVLFTIAWAFRHPPKILFGVYVTEYLALRFYATFRWHPNAKRHEGLELHFKKILIAVVYLLAISSGIGFWKGYTFMVWFSLPVFTFILYVNTTLITLHFKDKNKTPINYFSHAKFLHKP